MIRKADVEIDFLGMEERDTSLRFEPDTSFTRGVHNSMPNLNTQQLHRTAVTSAAPGVLENFHLLLSQLPSGDQGQRLLPTMPAVGSPTSRSAAGTSPGEAAPLTIFYNGAVTTFNLPRDQAEAIIDWAERSTSQVRPVETSAVAFIGGGGQQQQPPPASSLGKLAEARLDLPLMRQRSLKRFLDKRKRK